MRNFSLLGAIIILAGCGTQNQYIRANGQYASPEEVAADRAACDGQSDDKYCMVGKGYFLVSADQAATKQTQLASIAEQQRIQAQREAEAAAEAQKRAAAEARKRAAAKKKKQQTAQGKDVWPQLKQSRTAPPQPTQSSTVPPQPTQNSPWSR